ncbi:MAG: hypothetical protein A3A33_02225 [Candidatus Yanofskybacteria bacterium RIFCSPLOWO2_01_FULL_49_25]|uniref:Uncharacterized protein n=1 Tax=Candidatus Yanofskybacteria bacterium RIFCSPLOWO2_01_FULL_49_25 TaxID=1802701 RepID=A0A1F8GU46_9BACT|nr:MAG: hypothetical protein A3A33_02225 [Candidatus Yanofskybacteria bacterium RIFCSPLOWO2_01_FULL_49_25]
MWSFNEKLIIYAVHVACIALPLAIFEIIIEKDKGWGSGWDIRRWYAKIFAPESSLMRSIQNALHINPPLNYHVLVFGFLVPVLLALDGIFITKSVFMTLSILFGVLVFEDFLWFALNWNFHSLRELLHGPRGSISWHHAWIRIGSTAYIPASYFSGLAISLLFFLLS